MSNQQMQHWTLPKIMFGVAVRLYCYHRRREIEKELQQSNFGPHTDKYREEM